MKPHYFFGSVTRCSDLAEEPFDVQELDRAHWATGDFVVGRITGKRNRLYHCETRSGRMADLVRDDLIIGALGCRAATLEGVGDWRETGPDGVLEALTSAGLLGRSTSISPTFPSLVNMQYTGHVVRNGHKVTMRDFVTPAPAATLDIPVILLIGTSMRAGKTISAKILIRLFKEHGLRVVGAKITGAGRYRDILGMSDAGADAVFDFVDVGDGELAFAIGDVSGHGFSSALLMAETRAYLRSLVRTTPDLCSTLEQLNAFLCADTEDGRFVTLMLVKIPIKDTRFFDKLIDSQLLFFQKI